MKILTLGHSNYSNESLTNLTLEGNVKFVDVNKRLVRDWGYGKEPQDGVLNGGGYMPLLANIIAKEKYNENIEFANIGLGSSTFAYWNTKEGTKRIREAIIGLGGKPDIVLFQGGRADLEAIYNNPNLTPEAKKRALRKSMRQLSRMIERLMLLTRAKDIFVARATYFNGKINREFGKAQSNVIWRYARGEKRGGLGLFKSNVHFGIYSDVPFRFI